MKNKSRVIIGVSSLGVLAAALLAGSETVSVLLLGVFALIALVTLYVDMPNLANVSEENPKTKTLRNVVIVGIGAVALFGVIFVLLQKGVIRLTMEQEAVVAPLVAAVLIIGFGNVAPKLPFNRYVGLRLPWTVRDEESWIIAHRLLGWLSLPCGLLCLVGFGTLEYVPVIAVFIWGGIPALLSFLCYYKKHRL